MPPGATYTAIEAPKVPLPVVSRGLTRRRGGPGCWWGGSRCHPGVGWWQQAGARGADTKPRPLANGPVSPALSPCPCRANLASTWCRMAAAGPTAARSRRLASPTWYVRSRLAVGGRGGHISVPFPPPPPRLAVTWGRYPGGPCEPPPPLSCCCRVSFPCHVPPAGDTAGGQHPLPCWPPPAPPGCGCWGLPGWELTGGPVLSPQAGLDRMSQGHMLADVVAIIGTCPLRAPSPLRGGSFPAPGGFLVPSPLSFFAPPSAPGTQDIVFGEVDR